MAKTDEVAGAGPGSVKRVRDGVACSELGQTIPAVVCGLKVLYVVGREVIFTG